MAGVYSLSSDPMVQLPLISNLMGSFSNWNQAKHIPLHHWRWENSLNDHTRALNMETPRTLENTGQFESNSACITGGRWLTIHFKLAYISKACFWFFNLQIQFRNNGWVRWTKIILAYWERLQNRVPVMRRRKYFPSKKRLMLLRF